MHVFLLAAALSAVFVSPTEAATTLEHTGAVALDARGIKASAPHLPRTRVIDWMAYRDGLLRTGALDSDTAAVARRLRALGVSTDRPVVVYGDWREGWGEEGRIWWMLRYLGHPRVHILRGGVAAWVRAGLPTSDGESAKLAGGRFVVKIDAALRADWRRVDAARTAQSHLLLDTRRKDEYDGATPYASARGGHVPGALHFYWLELVGLPPDQVRRRLEEMGATRDTPVITYCTGGVRSAMAQAVLIDAGFDVANYDGSWWDWAARDELPVAP